MAKTEREILDGISAELIDISKDLKKPAPSFWFNLKCLEANATALRILCENRGTKFKDNK